MADKVPTMLFEDRPRYILRSRFEGKDAKPKTLHYFALQGSGELPRLCLEYTKTPYDMVMYFNTPVYKEFAPFGQLPCYQGEELGEGVYLTQSAAVSRHIARQAGIDGATAKDKALQDMVWEAGKDVFDKLSAVHAEEGDYVLVGILNGLTKLAKEGKCLGAGDRSSDLGVGEICVFHALNRFHQIKPSFLEPYPELVAFMKAVCDVPAIKNYFNSTRRMPLTENEIGKGYTGPPGYIYTTPANPESFKELYDK